MPKKASIAVVALHTIPLQFDEATGTVQLTPAGQFKAGDGRPSDTPNGTWLMDDLAFAAVHSFDASRKNDYVVDYEHQTLYSKDNGKPAPAAGWLVPGSLTFDPAKGLFGKVANWTEQAKTYLTNKEYRFLSPVFAYDKKTGRVLKFLSAALTNDPGVDGMRDVAALTAHFQSELETETEESSMNKELVIAILTALAQVAGVDITALKLETDEGLKDFQTNITAKLAALKTDAEKVAALDQQIATLKANPGKDGQVDPTQYVPMALYENILGQLVALRAQHGQESAEQLIEKARSEGRILEAEVPFFTSIGETNGLVALKGMLEKRTAIVALKGKQTDKVDEPGKKDGELDDTELAVCKLTGISPEVYKTTKAALPAMSH